MVLLNGVDRERIFFDNFAGLLLVQMSLGFE